MAHKETCYTCKMEFWMTDSFYDTMVRLKEKGCFFCPAGHSQHYVSGKTEAQKALDQADIYRRRAERATQRAAMLEDEVATTKRSAAAYKGAATRMKNRAKAGVCPCCNRTFQNLARHMKSQHPDQETDNVVELGQTA